MEDVITLQMLKDHAKHALNCCLDHIAQNMIRSPWTNKEAGWQEQWLQSKFTGLYATCNALSLLVHYKEEYGETIDKAVEELGYLFDNSIDYSERADDSDTEKKRKARCRFLLEQNFHTTLKGVYFVRAFELLKAKNAYDFSDTKMLEIIESVYKQIESVFCMETGCFAPAVGNDSDRSVLTTMQAFVVMKNRWGTASPETMKVKQLLLQFVRAYLVYAQSGTNVNMNKFDIYTVKINFVSALYALSHASDCLSKDERELLADVFFESMNDRDIRVGFPIKESYTVPDTMMARDTYIADSRMLYLKATVQLMAAKIIPIAAMEFFLDDFVEIIDTCVLKKQYLSWDSAPSFSHNIKGLSILHDLICLLEDTDIDFSAFKASPQLLDLEHRTIEPLNVVLFMSFSKEYSESVQETVHEVLEYLGFRVWWATNDPYDAFVVDSILERLSKAQFVIIDCSERSPNVMYEAGLAHGLAKPTLLCGCNEGVFPYETAELYDTCVFVSDGEQNPPPYRDLQNGILNYITDNLDRFCLTDAQKDQIKEKTELFLSEYVR